MEHQPLKWAVEVWKMSDLKPLENNPFGKISVENKRRLREKLSRLGVFEVAAIDTNGDLLTFNKRYHLLKEMGVTELEVKVPSRKLEESERKEIIISSNVHEGEWDRQILEELFTDIDLSSLGLDLPELDLPGETVKAEKPEYEIVPKFSEKHSALVIVVDNEIDLNHLQQILELGTEESYKSQATGQTYVLTAKRFLEIWKSRS